MASSAEGEAGQADLPDAFRVLVVDDDASVCASVVTLLNSRGHEAVGACSGAEALGRLQTEYFDVLLCDVRMPDMSGLELLTKALDLHPGMPVLMLSGMSAASTARDALHRGAMDYLTKPIELDELDRSVKAAARRRRSLAVPLPADTENVELRGGPLDKRRVRIEDEPASEAEGRLLTCVVNKLGDPDRKIASKVGGAANGVITRVSVFLVADVS